MISIDAGKALGKFQHTLMITILNKLGIKPQHNKSQCDRYIANIIHSGEKLRAFPLRSRMRQGCLLLPFLFRIVLEVLAR